MARWDASSAACFCRHSCGALGIKFKPMSESKKASPYLATPERLADVIAAIQTLGTYKFYKLDFASWADRISGDSSQGEYWKDVFEQHPEFFRLDSEREKASLVSRRQHQKRYSVDRLEVISKDEFNSLNEDEKKRISRTPLAPEEIGVLINTAVELHSRALEEKKHSRFLWPSIIGLIGVALGGAISLLSKCTS